MYNHQVLLSWTCVSHQAAAEEFNPGLAKNNYLGLAEYISQWFNVGGNESFGLRAAQSFLGLLTCSLMKTFVGL